MKERDELTTHGKRRPLALRRADKQPPSDKERRLPMSTRTAAGVHEKGAITLMDIVQKTKQNRGYPRTGAITIFIGTVRNQTENRKVQKLELQAYEEQANKTLHEICKDLNGREGITDVQIHHLLGQFRPGEELVYVLVAGTHRDKVFPVLQEAVERYKKEAPIFKKEHTIDKRGKTHAQWASEHGARKS